MSAIELRFCAQPPRSLWLKPEIPEGADGAVIGWIQDAAPIDSGVPPDVAQIVAKALVEIYRLTFVDPGRTKSLDWQDQGDYLIRFVRADGIGKLNPSAGYALTSTRAPRVAMRLFETAESLWTLQSQLVLLTDKHAQAPAVSFRAIDVLMRRRELDLAGLQAFGCRGIMTPGPDGDFAQLTFWQGGAMDEFERSLRSECEIAGLTFVVVSETDFERTNWFLKKVGP